MGRRVIILLILLLPCVTNWAQIADSIPQPDRTADDFVQASLVIVDPGYSMLSIIGHACLHMQCNYYDMDYYYSYESENPRNKLFSYMLGHLHMGMVPLSPDEFLSSYKEQGRGVREYRLLLSPIEKQELWRTLDNRVAEGMDLKLDYLQRGCAMSCIESVNEALRGRKIQYDPTTLMNTLTTREIVYRHWWNNWSRFLAMTFTGGKEVDNLKTGYTSLIVPLDLLNAWQHATLDSTPLLGEETTTLERHIEYNNSKFTPFWAMLIVLLISIANLFFKSNIIDYIFLIVIALWGIVVCYLAFFAPLADTGWNRMIVWLNPLPAIFWYWRQRWGLYYAIIIAIWIVAMLCTPHLYAETPHLLLAAATAITYLKQDRLKTYIYNRIKK